MLLQTSPSQRAPQRCAPQRCAPQRCAPRARVLFICAPGARHACYFCIFISFPRSRAQELALDAVQTVAQDLGGGHTEIDIKNYAKVEKIPGGTIEDCKVLRGACGARGRGWAAMLARWAQRAAARHHTTPHALTLLSTRAHVLPGVMFNKDVVVPGRMRRKVHKPRVLLLDCPLEYKKGENQTNVEVSNEEDWWVVCGWCGYCGW